MSEVIEVLVLHSSFVLEFIERYCARMLGSAVILSIPQSALTRIHGLESLEAYSLIERGSDTVK